MKAAEGSRLVWIAMACLASTLATAQAPTLIAQELFRGASVSQRPVPVEVEVSNMGPDASGFLVADTEYGNDGQPPVRYPIDLPRGSTKRVVIYGVSGYDARVVLRTDRGTTTFRFPPTNVEYANNYFVHIGDDMGGFEFLRDRSGDQSRFAAVYCTPEKAPPRTAGYSSIAAVLLGAGAERMSDASVRALREYVLLGGTLVFLGGPAPITWQDPRWRDLLPVVNPRVAVLSRLGRLGVGQAAPISGPATIATGDPISAAASRSLRGQTIVAVRGFGRGRVFTFGFDLASPPLATWNARRSYLIQALQLSVYGRSHFEGRFDSGAATAGGPTYATNPASGRPLNDPFQMEVPSTTFVGWVLFAFFVTVVPVNFLILRRLRKTEWAWVTSPAIAAAFTGVFLYQARSLYALGLSVGLDGCVIEHMGRPGALFQGTARMFFPHSGSHDLGLKDVDSVNASQPEFNEYGYGYPYEGQRRNTIRDFVDDGTVRAPRVETPNLAFEAMQFVQRIPGATFLRGTAQWRPKNVLRVEVTNVSRYRLRSIVLGVNTAAGCRPRDVSDLDPGESAVFEAGPVKTDPRANREWGALSPNGPIVFVCAEIEGFRPGPQVGKLLASASSVRLVSALEVPAKGAPR